MGHLSSRSPPVSNSQPPPIPPSLSRTASLGPHLSQSASELRAIAHAAEVTAPSLLRNEHPGLCESRDQIKMDLLSPPSLRLPVGSSWSAPNLQPIRPYPVATEVLPLATEALPHPEEVYSGLSFQKPEESSLGDTERRVPLDVSVDSTAATLVRAKAEEASSGLSFQKPEESSLGNTERRAPLDSTVDSTAATLVMRPAIENPSKTPPSTIELDATPSSSAMKTCVDDVHVAPEAPENSGSHPLSPSRRYSSASGSSSGDDSPMRPPQASVFQPESKRYSSGSGSSSNSPRSIAAKKLEGAQKLEVVGRLSSGEEASSSSDAESAT